MFRPWPPEVSILDLKIGLYVSFVISCSIYHYAQTLILVNLILVDCLGLFNCTQNGFLRVDHLWTQDNPICPLTVGGNTVHYIDHGRSTLKV